MTDLGTLPGFSESQANGINDGGQVVGWAYADDGTNRAFLYNNGKMTDLNTLIDLASGWTLTWANAINDNGQIVGWGTDLNGTGQYDAFLLTPVPEPSTLVLLGIGAASLLAYAWRKRIRTA